jgi:hypothetical protein
MNLVNYLLPSQNKLSWSSGRAVDGCIELVVQKSAPAFAPSWPEAHEYRQNRAPVLLDYPTAVQHRNRMRVGRTGTWLILGVLLAYGPVGLQAADQLPAPPIKFQVEDAKFAALARDLQARNWSFDDIFAKLCRTALTNAEANPRISIQDEARSIWGGMWLWTCQTIEPLPLFHAGGFGALHTTPDGKFDHGYDLVTLQKHFAQHFIAGGMFEAYFDMGREAGVHKERLNSVTGDYFDYNKVAVTTMGARWVDVAVEGDAQHAKRWLELWASGWYSLSKSMPKLHWESLQPFANLSPGRVKAVEDEVAAAITFPDDQNIALTTHSKSQRCP